MNEFIKEAIFQADIGVKMGHGGPFGAVVVKNGEVIGWGHNMIKRRKDPTAHAVMVALQNAGGNIGSHDLSDCELYTTSEPCSMCLSACQKAGITKVYYGISNSEAVFIGYRDTELGFDFNANLNGYLEQVNEEECKSLFDGFPVLD